MSHGAMVQLAVLLIVVIGSLAYARFKQAEGNAFLVTRDRGIGALSELRQWGTFLIGIQTGAISVMGFFLEKVGQVDGKETALDDTQIMIGVIATIFFGASIVTATWLLGAIPSLMLRLKEDASTENDFFHLTLFQSPRWPQIGPMTGLQYVLFAIGIVAFSVFVYLRMVTPHPIKPLPASIASYSGSLALIAEPRLREHVRRTVRNSLNVVET